MSIDLREIRERLQINILSLCKDMVPGGKVNGKYWIGKNPTRADKHAGSFWVLLQGQARGAWRDEAGIRGVDDGDVIKLVQYCRGLADLKETRQECLKWLGLSSTGGRKMSPAQIAERDRQRQAQWDADERREAAERAKNAKSAFGLWMKAEVLSPANYPGSLVDRYLRSRAIDLVAGMIAHRRALPGALRQFAAHDYRAQDGELIELPCMIALMSGPDGKPRGIHRTWLRPDGAGKAELPDPKENKPRKIWPAGWQGSVIRIAKGAGGHSPEEAARRSVSGPLIVTEGIEDGLACALAMPDRRVWAAGTLGNIGHVPNLPCISSFTVCADNDWGKGQAEAALEAAIAALRKHGKPVHVARSPRGKDMNDLLKGETI